MDDLFHVALMVRSLRIVLGHPDILYRHPFYTTPWAVSRSALIPLSSMRTKSLSLVCTPAASWLVVFTVPTVSVEAPFCKLDMMHCDSYTDYSSGCVVFGRVAGDSAASYTLSQLSNERAANRVNTIAQHLLETRIRVDPASKNVNLEFSWADGAQLTQSTQSAQPIQSAQSTQSVEHDSGYSSSGSSSEPKPAESEPARAGDRTATQLEPEKLPETKAKQEGKTKGEYSMDEVAKHNSDKDCWVVIDGEVLDVSNFLEEHPGGAKAILLYAGREATEEFNMIHPPNAIQKYAADTGESRSSGSRILSESSADVFV